MPKHTEREETDDTLRSREFLLNSKVCSRKRQSCDAEDGLPKYAATADGKDIVKRTSSRKGRYLFHIAGDFQPAVAGRMGTLSQLDSSNPVLHVDFPTGRLKLIGALSFPKNKHLLLKFGTKDVHCEQVFENVVTFAEAQWVGSAESNPDDRPLPLPAEVQTTIAYKSAGSPSGDSKTVEGSQPAKTTTPAKRKRTPSGDGDADATDAEEEADSAGGSKRRAGARAGSSLIVLNSSSDEDGSPAGMRSTPRRSSRPKQQQRLCEGGSDEDGSDSSNDDRPSGSAQPDSRRTPQGKAAKKRAATGTAKSDMPPRGSQAKPPARGRTAKQSPTKTALADGVAPPAMRALQQLQQSAAASKAAKANSKDASNSDPTPQKPRQQRKRPRKPVDSSSDDDIEEIVPVQSQPRPRQRAAAAKAGKSARKQARIEASSDNDATGGSKNSSDAAAASSGSGATEAQPSDDDDSFEP